MSQDKSSTTSDLRQRSTGLQDASLPRERLPPELQKIVDNEDTLMEQIYDGTSRTVPRTPQTPLSATHPTSPAPVQFSSVPTAT
ncbi:MAG: hypothetical protein Q9204_009465 [Flavoplaca sp. TL-2023a]